MVMLVVAYKLYQPYISSSLADERNEYEYGHLNWNPKAPEKKIVAQKLDKKNEKSDYIAPLPETTKPKYEKS